MVSANNAIRCSQCGGAARCIPGREYLQCEYCQSLVFTSENPLSVDRITPMGGTLDASCPTCDVSLSTGQIENNPVLYCGKCCGILLKNSVFGTVVRQRRARRIGVESEACVPLDTTAYDRKISCPACDRAMEVHPYYGPGNVVMDSCDSCEYVWLDHGELRSVETAEGSKKVEAEPTYVNHEGLIVVVPPSEERSTEIKSPLAALAEVLWGI